MFKITIPRPLLVFGDTLPNDLLTLLAPAGARVEYVHEEAVAQEPAKRRGRPPRATAPVAEPVAETPEVVSDPEPAAVEVVEPKPAAEYPVVPPTAPRGRGRPPKAAATVVEPKVAPPKAEPSGEMPDRAAMLEDFTKLVDADYEKAVELLTTFKVKKFSELKDDQLAAFAQAMK